MQDVPTANQEPLDHQSPQFLQYPQLILVPDPPARSCVFSFLLLQWNLFIMDTLGPAISGSLLLLYRGFPLSEVKMY